jgi:hypothetical protein
LADILAIAPAIVSGPADEHIVQTVEMDSIGGEGEDVREYRGEESAFI